jgi:hypothetical protein
MRLSACRFSTKASTSGPASVIEPFEAFDRRFDQALGQALVAHVSAYGDGNAAVACDGFDQGIELVLAASAHDYLGTGAGKETSGSVADA